MILQEEMTLGKETRSSLVYTIVAYNLKIIFLKEFSSEKRSKLKVLSIDWSRFKYSYREFYQNMLRLHPVRGLKLGSKGSLYYLRILTVLFKHGISFGLPHNLHIMHFADPVCLSRIRLFSIPHPRSEFFHPGSVSKNLSI
jgi:hypothetical protein